MEEDLSSSSEDIYPYIPPPEPHTETEGFMIGTLDPYVSDVEDDESESENEQALYSAILRSVDPNDGQHVYAGYMRWKMGDGTQTAWSRVTLRTNDLAHVQHLMQWMVRDRDRECANNPYIYVDPAIPMYINSLPYHGFIVLYSRNP